LRSPSEEVILLVGYGADGDGTPWSVNLAPAAQRLNQMRWFGSLLLISRPDAQTEREQVQVRNSLKRLAGQQSRILVVPILTLPSAGDPNIEQYLQGYTHEVARTGVIADARLVEWLLSRAAGQ
jgi:hypothetical protein